MSFLRSVATVGGFTLGSRVLGFARDLLIAASLGAGPIADAFFVALQIPNLFRRLFAEGAFSAAFVPLFSAELARNGRVPAIRFAEEALSVLLAALVLLVAAVEAAMPLMMLVFAPGFRDEPHTFHLAILFTRLTFPYLLFISLVSLMGGVLNSFSRFAAAAATPILFNLVLIGALLLAAPYFPSAGHALALGVSVAGVVQLCWLLLACRKQGVTFRLRRPRLSPLVTRLLRLMLPAALGAGAAQVNQVISTAMASLLPVGSISYLFYADRITQLPLGVIGVALGTALLPLLSRQIAAGEAREAADSLNRSLELGMLLILPAAAALLSVPHAVVSVLFQRGAFGPVQTIATAHALMAYAVGLPAFVLIKVLVPGFYARHDTKTPVQIAVVSVAANVVLNLALMGPLAHAGLALAVSLAAWLQTGLLGFVLLRRGHWRPDRRLALRLARTLFCALVMVAVLLALAHLLRPDLLGRGSLRYGALVLLIVAGGGVFLLLAQLSGAARLQEIASQLRRRPAE